MARAKIVGNTKDSALMFSEKAAKQMMDMAIQLFRENPKDAEDIPEIVIASTKVLIRRGQLKNGYICGANER